MSFTAFVEGIASAAWRNGLLLRPPSIYIEMQWGTRINQPFRMGFGDATNIKMYHAKKKKIKKEDEKWIK